MSAMDQRAGGRPPQGGPAAAYYRGRARCPWCGSTEVLLKSLFGGTVSELLFQCERCQSAFGVMKWDTLEDRGPQPVEE